MSELPGWASPGWTPPPAGPPTGGVGPGWGWGAPPPPPEVKPGVVPLRPLALGEILDGAITTIRRHPRVTLGLSAIVVTVQQLLALAINLSSFGPGSLASQIGDDTDPFASLGGALSFTGIVVSVIGQVLSVILTGLLTVVTAEAVLGRQVSLAQVWARVRPLLVPLVIASAIAGIAPYLGAVFLLIPGIFLWGALALTTPALVLERTGAWAAVKRSWSLAVGDWWRVWGIRALAWIIAAVISTVIVIPVSVLGAVLSATGGADVGTVSIVLLVLSTLGGIVAGTLTQPFTAAVVALLYIDRRMRAEGLDVSLRESARTGTEPG